MLVAGDYNAIVHQSEKCGGWPLLERQLEAFQSMLSNCDLRDMWLIGAPFTWCDKREGEKMICERLDRFAANSEWFNLFYGGLVSHGVAAHSDHVPIWLDTMGQLYVETKVPCNMISGRE